MTENEASMGDDVDDNTSRCPFTAPVGVKRPEPGKAMQRGELEFVVRRCVLDVHDSRTHVIEMPNGRQITYPEQY